MHYIQLLVTALFLSNLGAMQTGIYMSESDSGLLVTRQVDNREVEKMNL